MIDNSISRNNTRPLTTKSVTTPLSSQEAPPEASKKKSVASKVLGFVGDVFIGGGEAILDMGKGLVNTVMHPIQTVKGLAYVVTHPAALYHAFVDPYTTAIKEGHPGKALGRGIVEIGSLFVGPSEVVGAAKGVAKLFTGGTKAAGSAAAISAITGTSAEVAAKLASQASAVESKAGLLAKAGATAEAAKMGQYARLLNTTSSIAKAGDVTRAMRWATLASTAKTIKVAGTVTNMAGFLSQTDKILVAASAAGKAGIVTDKVGVAAKTGMSAAASTVASSVSDVLAQAGKTMLKHPLLLVAPPVAVAVTLGKMAALPDEVDAKNLTPEMAAQIAKKYNLDPGLENVKNFLGEVAQYKGSTVGPDTGTPEEVKQLQSLLRAAGYDVKDSGSFDDITSAAVIDFKQKNGFHQTYQMKNGQAAVNEYVDQKTAEALYRIAQGNPVEPPKAVETPKSGGVPPVVPDPEKQFAEQYGIEASPANVKAFRDEIAGYQQGTVGPDSDETSIKGLQEKLAKLGYQVEANGAFDDATAEAVIDFKKKSGLHQNYQLTNGESAVNEYVGETTAKAIEAKLAIPVETVEKPRKAADILAKAVETMPKPTVPAAAPSNAELPVDPRAAKREAADGVAAKLKNLRQSMQDLDPKVSDYQKKALALQEEAKVCRRLYGAIETARDPKLLQNLTALDPKSADFEKQFFLLQSKGGPLDEAKAEAIGVFSAKVSEMRARIEALDPTSPTFRGELSALDSGMRTYQRLMEAAKAASAAQALEQLKSLDPTSPTFHRSLSTILNG